MAESFRSIAQRLRKEGARTDEWLLELRRAGATQVDAVKLVRELEGISLGNAKAVVDESPVWQDMREVNRQLREAAGEALEALEAEDDAIRDRLSEGG